MPATLARVRAVSAHVEALPLAQAAAACAEDWITVSTFEGELPKEIMEQAAAEQQRAEIEAAERAAAAAAAAALQHEEL